MEKLTIDEIRADLREIRYYYSKQKVFDSAAKTVSRSSVMDTVDIYNEVIKFAPARLYDLYIALYVQNNSQEALAYDWGFSAEYIRRLNKQLYGFLLKALTE